MKGNIVAAFRTAASTKSGSTKYAHFVLRNFVLVQFLEFVAHAHAKHTPRNDFRRLHNNGRPAVPGRVLGEHTKRGTKDCSHKQSDLHFVATCVLSAFWTLASISERLTNPNTRSMILPSRLM